jgi:hypothetical protein
MVAEDEVSPEQGAYRDRNVLLTQTGMGSTADQSLCEQSQQTLLEPANEQQLVEIDIQHSRYRVMAVFVMRVPPADEADRTGH